MSSIILKNYPEQKYKVMFNQKTGLFARVEEKGVDEIFWSKQGPELLDISITNWCDQGCSFCYKNSNLMGNHMSLEDYEIIIKQASETNVFQVALGGGNPNQHPDFVEILKITREKYNIVPSYTTNGKGLTKEILKATRKYCGAVAVSMYEPYEVTEKAVDLFKEYGVRVNLHYVLNSKSIISAIKLLENGHKLLEKSNAIIFLNYKPIGNNKDNNLLLKNSSYIQKFFMLVDNHKQPIKIGFDSCMVSGIVKYMKNYNIVSLEACDAGRFSAYISEDLKMYPCSFMVESFQGEDLISNSLIDIWNNSKIFTQFKNHFNSNRCNSCEQQSDCLNGCPFLRELDLC